MAPINEYSSYSTYSSASNQKPFSCMCRHSLDDEWEWFLPITRRGHFFQDSFFENARSLFDGAVRDVLGRWGDTGMLKDSWQDSGNTLSNLSRYRQLRSHNIKEENQAVTASSDSSSYKIVLDVHEFTEGDIKVKVIAEKEISVEGTVELKEAGYGASMKRFSRRFPLAGDADVDGISSVMSSDGILTISVPRKVSAVNHETVKKVENKSESSQNVSRISNTSSSSAQQKCQSSMTSARDTSTENGASARYCESCYKKLQSEKNHTEEAGRKSTTKIPVDVQSSKASHSTSASGESQKVFETNSVSEKRASNTSNSQTNSSSTVSNQSEMKSTADSRCASVSKNSSEEMDVSSRHVPISVNFHRLPITRRGLFFNDSIFEDSRHDFESAVRDVLTRWGERSSIMDDLSSYRSLRTRDLREENQAVKVNEDETSHKFVLDVRDFMDGGEVNVKAVNDRELVVEGQIEKQEGGSKSVKRFYKRFAVPGDIVLESVTSVMSSDGVLTITAPKKAPTIQIRDVTSPVRLENTKETSRCNQETAAEERLVSQSSGRKNVQESFESSSKNIHDLSSARQNNTGNEHIIQVKVEERAKQENSGGTVKKVQSDSECSGNHIVSQGSSSSSSAFSKESSTMSNNSTMSENSVRSSTESTETTRDSQERANSSSTCQQRSCKVETESAGAVRNSQDRLNTSSVCQQRSCNTDQSLASVGRLLPITRKGNFFSDSFFEDSRQSFQKAVKSVLQKFNENSKSDDLSAYRSLRLRSLTEENQALNIYEDEHSHKVVIDAKDFTDGDISVSVVNERELLIEGKSEIKEGSTSSSHTFSRRFLLPEEVDIQSITSAISSDGVLTVESLKKGSAKGSSQVQKTSNEAHSRHEDRTDSGHSWEEKRVKESSEQSEGYSCKSYSTSYRAHHEHSSSNVF